MCLLTKVYDSHALGRSLLTSWAPDLLLMVQMWFVLHIYSFLFVLHQKLFSVLGKEMRVNVWQINIWLKMCKRFDLNLIKSVRL